MIAIAQAYQLMEQALDILDSKGMHQSAAMLDAAILALPRAAQIYSSRLLPPCLPRDGITLS